MLIRFPADSSYAVWLTDDPQTAASIRQKEPVIGITGPEPEYSLWSGTFYLAESVDAVDGTYAKRVWSRFYKKPMIIAKTEAWYLREMTKADLPALRRMYREPDIRRYLEHPTGGDERDEAWEAWCEAYIEHIYRMDEPAMWVLTDREGRLLGRLGMEWQTICQKEGYFLGYALLPEARGKGLITQAARMLIDMSKEEWGITEIYLACEKQNQASAACAGRLKFELIHEDQLICVFCMSASIE